MDHRGAIHTITFLSYVFSAVTILNILLYFW
jgi:hypothetical protein